jgi:8-oxo-dGTP pyrophosphatase MutT (NUDIX family)
MDYNNNMEDKFKLYKDYKTILSVNALIWCNGKVLLLKRAETKSIDPGVYSGIGGKVEPGESVYDALLREIEEETGLKEFEKIKAYSVTQHPYPPTGCEWINIYFNVTIKNMVQIPESSEGTFDWIDPKAVDSLEMVNDLKEYIKILSKNPEAFILGFFNNDSSGNPTEKTVKIL